MDHEKEKALEAAGWRVGTVQEFLGLSETENQMVELRVALALRVRQHRRELGLTQAEFARQMGSSQSRVAKLEAGEATISLDMMFRGFFAAGGRLIDLADPPRGAKATQSRRAGTVDSGGKNSKTKKNLQQA